MRTVLLLIALAAASVATTCSRAPEPPAGAVVDAATPAPALRDIRDIRDIRDFRPFRDGFRFVNRFTGASMPGPLAAVSRAMTGGHYGLCGGMSFAAADFFLARRDIPQSTTAPADDSDLYRYIWQRQSDSFVQGSDAMAMVRRFADWMLAPNDGPLGTHALTLPQLRLACNELDAGRPVVLGLVYAKAGDGRALWDNHQVLAYSWTAVGNATIRLKIYDPNFPRNDAAYIEAKLGFTTAIPAIGPGSLPMPVLSVTSKRRVPKTDATAGGRDIPVRGFFVMPFEAKVPPEVLR